MDAGDGADHRLVRLAVSLAGRRGTSSARYQGHETREEQEEQHHDEHPRNSAAERPGQEEPNQQEHEGSSERPPPVVDEPEHGPMPRSLSGRRPR
jgi:hypothetical protein